jgi:hypothetical protein
MGMSIEEMKLVDSTRAQLEQLAVQVANREAAMKRDAANEGLIQFKTYFANREFALSGNEWNVTATHGSIIFSLAIKNAQTGGPECLILKFPEMTRLAPISIFMEVQETQSNEAEQNANDGAKSLLTETLEKVAKMRERLNAPPKKWGYYSLKEQTGGTAAKRKDYLSFNHLLSEECP